MLPNQNGPLQMKYVILTIPHSTFPKCTGKQAKLVSTISIHIGMLQLCPAIPAKFPHFQIITKTSSWQNVCHFFFFYLTALGIAWQSVKEGWGDKRGGKRVELTRDEVLQRICVCMCVSVYFLHVCECSKSINVRKFSKSILELISDCQIYFPSCCPSFK